MSQIKQTKNRIGSAQTTAKITKAMQTIASMRLRKFQKQASVVSKYFDGLMDSLGSTLNHNNNPILIGNPEGKSLVIIAGTSRGFCGGLHRTIVTDGYKQLLETGIDLSNTEKVELITISRPTNRMATKLGANIKANFDAGFKVVDTYSVLPIAELVNQLWLTGNYKDIHIVFAKNKSALKPSVILQKILPFGLTDSKVNDSKINEVINYETNQDELILESLSLVFQAIIHQSVLSTQTAEESARIVAMNQATDNAKTLENKLKIVYFRQRQSKITQEISEIIGGSL
jgi:F-type H+-transporting ATPase subunit gamma